MPKNKRFSKQAMIARLSERIKTIEEQYRFSSRTGYAQVVGKAEDVQRAYGKYDGFLSLRDELEEGWIP